MSKARMETKNAEGKSMTQKELATKVNEKPTIIQEYENGKASEYMRSTCLSPPPSFPPTRLGLGPIKEPS